MKYALKELLEGKTADEILDLTICEPAMGSAAFLNEAINQLAEAYISRKEQDTGNIISYENRFNELQKVKMYIADRNVYGIDLNPVAVELAEVSLWLNTIYEGGYVPWFGTQLVNGNSLIGARRQVYSETSLQTSSKGLHWYENAPERVPLGTKRKMRRGNAQIYHFLLGDPGMCNYKDKVIKQLEPDNIKKMKDWNKRFIAPYSDSELETLRQLSLTVDELWENQITLRKTVDKETQDALSIFGREDVGEDSQTTIRQKDLIYSKLYKSEHMKNAGPYARLKFAMDYWCALWFWPIEQAEMLPSRSEFFNDLNLILVGTVNTGKGQASIGYDQLSLFDDEREDLQLIHKINAIQGTDKTEVNLDSLCMLFPRLALVRQIAEQNHFMHWELEFADLFAEKGGFDLVIGNPPWIKMEWNEQNVLSDRQPMFAVKKFTATQTTHYRNQESEEDITYGLYFDEYVGTAGQQTFLNAVQNYPDLKGQQTNLFKCFLPQAWMVAGKNGVSAFIHPDGVYDDPRGGALRKELYPRLCYHFQFTNEIRLFDDVHHNTVYSLNIYNNHFSDKFDTINNLFVIDTIEQCYAQGAKGLVPGIKDDSGWCTQGHPDRVIHVGRHELKMFAKLFDGSDNWQEARLPVLHARQLVEVLEKFAEYDTNIISLGEAISTNEMWHETNRQKDGTIKRDVHFPEDSYDAIISGPHIGVANPLFKSSRRKCLLNSDYDVIDLNLIPDSFLQRCNYRMACTISEYRARAPIAPISGLAMDDYRVVWRSMLNQGGERTMIPIVLPPKVGHVDLVYEFAPATREITTVVASSFASIPFDFYIKATGKAHARLDVISSMPYIASSRQITQILNRALLLNCLTTNYSDLWNSEWKDDFVRDCWAKRDVRLQPDRFSNLTQNWTWDLPLRTDYERREGLVEIDVLTAMALGMTIDQLKTIYRIQFPILQQYEADTWYDANGRIVFTINRSMNGVGVSRSEWENKNAIMPSVQGTAPWDGIMKNAPAGFVFEHIINDDTMPDGPVERTIKFVAPFDRCDREKDYETVWKFFEEKYGKE